MKENICETVLAALAVDLPVLLWGAPGSGKTAAIRALAAERHAYVETLIGSQIEAADVGGQPFVRDSEVAIAPPAWAKRIAAILSRGGAAWLFLDELSTAPASVQAAFLHVINEREVAGLSLVGCRMLAAANPADTAADNGWISPAMANRWVHVEWKPTVESWLVGILSNFGAGWTSSQASVAPAIADWIRRKPDQLDALPADASRERAWPSRRSWTAAVRLLSAVDGGNKSPHAEALLAAAVGPGAVRECAEFLRALDLPDPEALLAGSAGMPKRRDQIYAVVAAVAATALLDRTDRDARVARAWRIFAGLEAALVLHGAAALLQTHGDIPDEAVELAHRINTERASLVPEDSTR